MTHKIRERRSQCSICGFEAVIPNRLRAHILDVHNEFQVRSGTIDLVNSDQIRIISI